MLNGEKELVPLAVQKPVVVGHFQEVSVKSLWPQYKDRPEVKRFFPPKMTKGRSLDRSYFFNVMNTFLGDELQSILQHAHSQRNSVT